MLKFGYFIMYMMVFSIHVLHGGHLATEPVVHYTGEKTGFVSNVDIDRWSYFEAIGTVREDFGYGGAVKLWWRGVLDAHEFREFTSDAHAMDMVNYAKGHNGEVYMYVDSKDGNEGVVGDNFDGANEGNDEGNDDNNNEDSFPSVQLDDSKEERANDMDDGFDIAVSEGEASRIGWAHLSTVGINEVGGGEASVGGGEAAKGVGVGASEGVGVRAGEGDAVGAGEGVGVGAGEGDAVGAGQDDAVGASQRSRQYTVHNLDGSFLHHRMCPRQQRRGEEHAAAG